MSNKWKREPVGLTRFGRDVVIEDMLYCDVERMMGNNDKPGVALRENWLRQRDIEKRCKLLDLKKYFEDPTSYRARFDIVGFEGIALSLVKDQRAKTPGTSVRRDYEKEKHVILTAPVDNKVFAQVHVSIRKRGKSPLENEYAQAPTYTALAINGPAGYLANFGSSEEPIDGDRSSDGEMPAGS